MKKYLPFIVLAAILVAAFISPNIQNSKGSLITRSISKEKALEELDIQVLDKTRQWDQKVSIAYTNISAEYVFELTQTGLRYSESKRKKDKYLIRRTPIVLQPQQTVELEISIPFFIKPKVAYALKEDVQITIAKN